MHREHKTLSEELKEHIPFTILGAASGIVLMLIFNYFFTDSGSKLFMIFHPLHVVLSAFATTMLFRLRSPKTSLWKIIAVGYLGSIGVATISDSVIPYCGERIMGISIPTHSHDHHHEDITIEDNHSEICTDESHQHIHGKPDIHIGFIEDWQLVNSSAVIGIALGLFLSVGKLPHASHVLVSTWASMAHIMMNTAAELTLINYVGIFVVLFLAVWLPCCVSDIVFPTLFSIKHIE